MGKKLTQDEFKQRVKDRVGDKYSVIGEYKGKKYPILIKCNIHEIEFTASADAFMRAKNDVRCNCPKCFEEERNKKKEETSVLVQCAYCDKEFWKSPSSLNNSKSGFHFCCREHKDLAQKLSSDKKFRIMLPPHYGENRTDNSIKKKERSRKKTEPSSTTYRTIAFNNYEHKCAICGYHDDDDISLLDVHHIDSDRGNMDASNLIILCPNCHRKLTSKKYKLIDRSQLIKIK